MAIIESQVTGSFVEDRDSNVFIGIELPFYKSNGSEGYFASTTTTVQAVKNNIKNLLLTEQGERFFQPDIGVKLKKYLFEPIQSSTEDSIREEILSSFSIWLPFVNITRLDINMDNGENEFSRNSIFLDIEFNINQMPNSLESVQIQL